MEKIKAKIIEKDGKYSIQIGDDDHSVDIPLSENDPLRIKKSFNEIIMRIKKGLFSIELDDSRDDLFGQVSKEYIQQLNAEILEVHNELKSYNLLDVN